MRKLWLSVLLIIIYKLLLSQYAPHAGLIIPYSSQAVIITSSGVNKKFISDGKSDNFWESDNPLPVRYVTREDLNLFARTSNFKTSFNQKAVFDGDLNSGSKLDKGRHAIQLTSPVYLFLTSLKFQTTKPFSVEFVKENKTLKKIHFGSEQNFQWVNVDLGLEVSEIIIETEEPVVFFEIAALMNRPTEFVLFDMGREVPVGQIWAKTLNDQALESIEVLAGNDLNSLKHLLFINPQAIPLIPYLLPDEIKVRYVKIVFRLPIKNYYKVKLWEFDLYDYYGPYGKPSDDVNKSMKFGDAFGVNAIWGWGYNVYSDRIPEGKGPWLFAQISKSARIYHPLDWDVTKPSQSAGYNLMQKNGTSAREWLDWDREYAALKRAGFEKLDVCLMFNHQNFPDTLWDDPYHEAFLLGREYAEHFSRLKFVSQVEVGNEPWQYNPKVYKEVLGGFADGVNQTAPEMVVLPCAVQAYQRYAEANHYIATYLDASLLSKIDGLNTHLYNYIYDRDGNRKAIRPEDPRAELWSVSNLKRYLLKNARNKKIYVTEFGYDSEGGGESCTHPVCVSEHEQAIYGVRAALILFRLGVDQFYWYYFANVAYQSFLHNRSGLVSSSDKGFLPKESFGAFKILYGLLKDYKFDKVLCENDLCYAYQLITGNGDKIWVMWRPTSENHAVHRWVELPIHERITEVIPVVKDDQCMLKGRRVFLSGSPVIVK